MLCLVATPQHKCQQPLRGAEGEGSGTGQGSKPGSAEGHVLVEWKTVTPRYLPWEGGSCQDTCKPFCVKREGWQHLSRAAVQGEEILQRELSSGKNSGDVGDTLLAHGTGTQDAHRA